MSRHFIQRAFLSWILCTLTIGLSDEELVAKETDTETHLSGISSSMQPDLFTGSLTTSVPIVIPPGRNGMQPNLALAYASSGGNGWVGMGWKFDLGTVERQTRFGVNYSQDDYSVRMNGMSGDLVQAPVASVALSFRSHLLELRMYTRPQLCK